MFHPLIRLLATRPQLVATHLGGYVGLASAQAMEAMQSLQARMVWGAAAVAGLAAGSLLGGTALLLCAVVPIADMPAPWLLVATPGLPLLAGVACWLQARRKPLAWSLAPMQAQFAADAALLDELERA